MNRENNQSTDEFDAFVTSGEVEVGESNLTSQQDDEPKKTAPRRGPPKAAIKPEAAKNEATEGPDDGDTEDGIEDNQTDEDQEEDDTETENKRSPKESQIDRLKRERAVAQREARELRRRIDSLENGDLSRRLENLEKGLHGENNNANSDTGKPVPDPTDASKYPLGHLDDRYIEDKLEWLATKKATERADAVLQRQQENERNQMVQRDQQVLLEKADDLVSRSTELYDDFQENVVETGMRGDWDLSQTTFEAVHEAKHGAQILYELSQDKKEASRVAKLSSYQQVKFVLDRNTEIAQGKQARRIPQAGEPPKNTARGANSRTQINPATDNLDDFEKAWEADAKKGNR